jgi:hypothetical protein
MAEVTRAEYADAAAAIRTLAKRMTKAEEGLNAAISAIITLTQVIQKIDPDRMDKELRALRLLTQEAEAGRVESKLTKENRAQLLILETALGRRGSVEEDDED